jgi:capsule polysaccharide export protein KpsE/RkpR
MRKMVCNKYYRGIAGIAAILFFSKCETQEITKVEPRVVAPQQEKLIIMADPDPLVEEKENMVFQLESKIESVDELIINFKKDAEVMDSGNRVHLDVTIAKLEKEKAKLKVKLKEVQNATSENWPQTKSEAKNRIEIFDNDIIGFYGKK